MLRVTRNQALNRLERERLRRHESIDAEEPMALPDPDIGPDARAEQDEQRRLIWTAAAVLGERDTSLLDLHLRHGLGPAEIAEELSITSNNANQMLFRLRGQLRDTIGAVVLWRKGSPACQQLARLVGTRRAFDVELSTTIRRHRRDCITCTTEVQRRQPELLFAAIPVAVAAAALKDQARAALAQAGVPVLLPPTAPAAAPLEGGSSGGAASGPVRRGLGRCAGGGSSAGGAPGGSSPREVDPWEGKPGTSMGAKVLAATGAAVLLAAVLGVVGSGLLPGGGSGRDLTVPPAGVVATSGAAPAPTRLAVAPVANGSPVRRAPMRRPVRRWGRAVPPRGRRRPCVRRPSGRPDGVRHRCEPLGRSRFDRFEGSGPARGRWLGRRWLGRRGLGRWCSAAAAAVVARAAAAAAAVGRSRRRSGAIRRVWWLGRQTGDDVPARAVPRPVRRVRGRARVRRGGAVVRGAPGWGPWGPHPMPGRGHGRH